jgi:hypothetical protein
MYLCTQFDAGEPVYSETQTVSACAGYISEPANNFGLALLTYSDAEELLGATALLFAVAFIIRATLHFIQNR